MHRLGGISPLLALALFAGCRASSSEPAHEAATELPRPPIPVRSEAPPATPSSAPVASVTPATSAATSATASASAAASSAPVLPPEIAHVFAAPEDLAPGPRSSFESGVEAFQRKDFAAAEKAFLAVWKIAGDARIQILVAQMQLLQGKKKQACDNFAEGWNAGASLMRSGYGRGDLPYDACPRLMTDTHNRP